VSHGGFNHVVDVVLMAFGKVAQFVNITAWLA
jgi:hypothetical protein